MKSKFTYLLLLCIISFAGISHADNGIRKNFSSYAHTVKVYFSNHQDAGGQQQNSLIFNDDNEEDEIAITKREISFVSVTHTNDLIALSNILHSFRKYQPAGHLCNNSFSRKYILLRVFRV